MEFSNIKGFAFDLDGVITDTARFHAEAWQALGEKLGIEWNEAMENGTKGISRMDSLNLILREGGRLGDFSEEEKEALATEKNDLYKTFIQKLTPADILPGIAELLNDLRVNGYKIALASASHNAPVILERLGLSDTFDAIVDPATLSKGKPDPEIYRRAAEAVGLKPEQMIGVEDAKSGVEAINAAGEVSVGIGDATMLKEADINFVNTAECSLEHIKNAAIFQG